MKLAIMQPYFFPYIGYFQLMKAVDTFIIYDNIQFSKKGWINRNRILLNGKGVYITLPLKKDSDYLDVKERFLADFWHSERNKLLNKIEESYKRAPFFKEVFPLIKTALLFDDPNLFGFIFNSIKLVREFLEIDTRFVISSALNIDHSLKSENKVIEICKALKAGQYINPAGGAALYNKDNFQKNGIELSFLSANNFNYPQFENKDFIPALSIIDVMMFNSKKEIQSKLNL
jgi:hypothetical protein